MRVLTRLYLEKSIEEDTLSVIKNAHTSYTTVWINETNSMSFTDAQVKLSDESLVDIQNLSTTTYRDGYMETGNGNDSLFGNDEGDTLIGNLGNDYLSGGNGDDLYIFNFDDGNDIIEDIDGNDTIKLLGENIELDQLYAYYDNEDLVLKVKNHDGSSITIKDYNSNEKNTKIENIELYDTTLETTQSVTLNNILNHAPEAYDDEVTLNEDTSIDIDILTNDTDDEGDPITLSVISQIPLHGLLSLNDDGTIKYTPDENFFGEDSFKYIIKDDKNGRSEESTVSITVENINDAPILSVIESRNLNEDATIINGTIEATDMDGDTLTYSTFGAKI
jgi:VCBS repeat-containing protein